MTAYYNENDSNAAAWLRELIKRGCIASGEVDERSIVDVSPSDLAGYDQCHFFAGVGGWSYALRLSRWSDARPVWTGSCPCQPFSAAGEGRRFDDERHLWPAWFHLIAQCRPAIVFGEQVSSKAALGWFDVVQNDLEGAGYSVGAADISAAGVGAPHIRQRLYYVADTDGGNASAQREQRSRQYGQLAQDRRLDRLEHAKGYGRIERRTESSERSLVSGCGESVAAEHTESEQAVFPALAREPRSADFWTHCERVECTDGKARPIEPGSFPLANGIPDRVGLLRGYGNAIVPQVAQAFIESYLDSVK